MRYRELSGAHTVRGSLDDRASAIRGILEQDGHAMEAANLRREHNLYQAGVGDAAHLSQELDRLVAHYRGRSEEAREPARGDRTEPVGPFA